MKVAAIAYLPPKGKCNAEAFVANLSRYKMAHPLITISDDRNWHPTIEIGNPESIGHKPAYALNNLLFCHALLAAKAAQLEYFFYVESDSRVGCDNWDDQIYAEYFGRYPNGIDAAGTPVVYNVNCGGREAAMRILHVMHAYQCESNMPGSYYGNRHPFDGSSGITFYPNGSLMMLHTQSIVDLFPHLPGNIAGTAMRMLPFDMELGNALYNKYGPFVSAHVGWLTKSLSHFGEAITTENERLAMLYDGKRVAIHQCKSNV